MGHKIANVPLADLENLGDYFLFLDHFSGHFEGASTFLTPKLSLAALWIIQESKMAWPSQNIP